MSEEPKLLPCPFCGSHGKDLRYQLTEGAGDKWGAVHCACGALGPDVRGYQATGWEWRAAEEWNTRKGPKP